jgi:hypothetical protein
MTQDKIREAFEAWLGAPNDSWKDDPLSVGSIQEEAWQACAAEMLPVIKQYHAALDGLLDAVNMLDRANQSSLDGVVLPACKALALADKWRG